MLGNLPHVIIEVPAARVFAVSDVRQSGLHDGTFCRGNLRAVCAQHRHRHVARITIEDHEAKGLGVLGIPGRGRRQFAELARGHAAAVAHGAFPGILGPVEEAR
jgi:hypothetical protein